MNAHEMIRMSVLGCQRHDLYGRDHAIDRLSICDQDAIADMENRWQQGEPLQYVLGESHFLGSVFFVDPRVLIPRPETELMVDTLIGILDDRSRCSGGMRMLDVGTGSGCIAVSLAKHFPDAHLTAVDVSSAAIEVAHHNAVRHGVDQRIDFQCQDANEFYQHCPDHAYDVIISNPPYIPTQQLSYLPCDVQHEPRIALDGGSDGLTFYRDLIAHTPRLLRDRGLLVCEFWDGQERDLNAMLTGFGSVEFFKDLSGSYRFFKAVHTDFHCVFKGDAGYAKINY